MVSPLDIRARLVAVLEKIYLPRCGLNGWQWCEKNIKLAPEESRDNHGQYSTSDTLYVRRVFEFITNPNEKELIIRKSAQLGFTLAYMLIICYLAATAPTHVLYAMHSAKKAKEISVRLKRILRSNRALADSLLDEGEDTLQNLLLKLKGMDIVLTGSGSPGEFDAASFGFVALDELDRHKPGPKQSANTIDLARDRIKEVQAGKLLAGGTPEEWDGETNQNYLTGTREELHVQCPFCHAFQPIRFERLRFDHCKNARGEWDYQRIYQETYYDCVTEGCSTPERRIFNKHKREMLKCARWCATNTGDDEHKPFPGRASIWINDLYSLREQNTWGHIAALFIDAQKSLSKLRKFFNRVLGLPRREGSHETRKEDVARLAGGYDHGCMPVSPAINPITGLPAIFVFADVQASEKKWVKAGFTTDSQCYVIDYGKCLSYDELNAIADRPVLVGMKFPSEEEMRLATEEAIATNRLLVDVLRERHPGEWHADIAIGGVDEGNGGDTQNVRTWCLGTAHPQTGVPRFFPTKGVARTSVRDIVDEKAGKFFVDGVPITVYHFSDDDIKVELYVGRIGQFDRIAAGKSSIPRLHLPAYPEEEFLSELSQERRGEIMYKGKKVLRWLDPKGPNDWGDGVKGVLTLWHIVKADFAAPSAPPSPGTAEMDASGRIVRPPPPASA